MEDEMVGCCPLLYGHEFKQTLGDSEGQGSLACCSPWVAKSRTWFSNPTQQQQQSLAIYYCISDYSSPFCIFSVRLGMDSYKLFSNSCPLDTDYFLPVENTHTRLNQWERRKMILLPTSGFFWQPSNSQRHASSSISEQPRRAQPLPAEGLRTCSINISHMASLRGLNTKVCNCPSSAHLGYDHYPVSFVHGFLGCWVKPAFRSLTLGASPPGHSHGGWLH